MNEWEEAAKHPRWDPKTKRILLKKEEIEALPVKTLDKDTFYAKLKSIYWTGWEWYPHGFNQKDDEVGYDNEARYVLKREPADWKKK